MNRAWVLAAGLSRRKFLSAAALGLAGLAGCKQTEADQAKVTGRSQVNEDPALEVDASTTLGERTIIGNTEPIIVSGVGLVYGLAGTGSSPPPGGWRTMLEQSLKKSKDPSVRQSLDDPGRTTSLVIVNAVIPPGARKDDPIDVQISLPDESKTTSLRGGILFPCELHTNDTTGNIKSVVHEGRPGTPGGDLLRGDLWAVAAGPVLAGHYLPTNGQPTKIETDADGQPVCKVARIWGGAKVAQSRPYYVLLNPGSQSPQLAATLAERLNSTFHATAEPRLKVAEAKSRELILVNVPLAYRNNHHRFLLTARQVPLLPPAPTGVYRKKLEDELLDPATTLASAVKLEALGASSTHSLRIGLESTSPWVRFTSAEALMYLGQTDGAGELARLAEDHPALRAPCLKALAATDDSSCTDRLAELMASPDAHLRYGAFLALRLADENAPGARGLLVNKSYWLHRLAPSSAPLVHLTSDRRCEVVLFGDGPKLRGPFTLPVGSDFTVHVPAGGEAASVTRIVTTKTDLEEKRVPCPADLASVLATIGRLGGGYEQAVEFIRKADRAQVLGATLTIDAVPAEMGIRQLAQFASQDPTLTRVNAEVARAGVVRPDLDAVGFDLPPAQPDPTAQVAPPPPRPPLNRAPGRIFGPKRHDTPAIDPGVVPAGGQ